MWWRRGEGAPSSSLSPASALANARKKVSTDAPVTPAQPRRETETQAQVLAITMTDQPGLRDDLSTDTPFQFGRLLFFALAWVKESEQR